MKNVAVVKYPGDMNAVGITDTKKTLDELVSKLESENYLVLRVPVNIGFSVELLYTQPDNYYVPFQQGCSSATLTTSH